MRHSGPFAHVALEQYGFSSGLLALIFATYALVLIPSLLAFGQLRIASAAGR